MSDELPIKRLQEAATNPDAREAIMAMESYLRQFKQGDFPLKHHFAEHSYGREIFIPKGSYIVGKIHRHSHLNVISMGDVTVITEFGFKRMKAPMTFVSEPGTKRALYAHEDTIWTTIHVTDKQIEAEIEEEIIAPDYETYDSFALMRNLSTVVGNSPTLDDKQKPLGKEDGIED